MQTDTAGAVPAVPPHPRAAKAQFAVHSDTREGGKDKLVVAENPELYSW